MVNIFVQDLIENLKLILIFPVFFGARMKDGKKIRFICGVCMMAFSLCHALFLPFFPISIIDILFFLCTLRLYEGFWQNKLIASLLAWVGVELWDSGVQLLYAFIKNMNPFIFFESDYVWVRTGFLSVLLPVLLYIWWRTKSQNRKRWLEIKMARWQYVCLTIGCFSVLTIVAAVLLYLFYDIRPEMLPRFYLILGIACFGFLIPVFILYFYSRSLKEQTLRQKENILAYERKNELQEKYYTDMRAGIEELQQFRHDYRYHMQMLFVLLGAGKVAEAQEYLKEVQNLGKQNGHHRWSYTGNLIVDASILGVLSQFENQRIKFQCKGHLPLEIHIKSVDLCELISNAMENAAHACAEMENPCIELQVKIYGKMICFELKNKYAGKVDLSMLQENKSGRGDGHGYGIYNMSRVVKKYQGHMRYDVDAVYVTLQIELLQNTEVLEENSQKR